MVKKNKNRATSKLTKTSKLAKVGRLNQFKIRQLREAKGLSLTDAAKAAGFKSSIQWWDIEKKPGRDPQVSTVAKVARVLGCKVDDLLKA